jgi:hypothetical protein
MVVLPFEASGLVVPSSVSSAIAEPVSTGDACSAGSAIGTASSVEAMMCVERGFVIVMRQASVFRFYCRAGIIGRDRDTKNVGAKQNLFTARSSGLQESGEENDAHRSLELCTMLHEQIQVSVNFSSWPLSAWMGLDDEH